MVIRHNIVKLHGLLHIVGRSTLMAATLLLASIATADTNATDIAAGQKLAFDRVKGNCLACHYIQGGGGPW